MYNVQVLEAVTEVATIASQVKSEVKEVADRATAIVEEIAVDKGIAEEKLEAARPALEEAEAALLVSAIFSKNFIELVMYI